MAYSGVATFGFVATNNTKVTNGDWTRLPVLAGQTCNAVEVAVKAGAKKNTVISKTSRAVSAKLGRIAQSDSIFKGVSKTVDFIRKNINPLIVVSGITKVALAKEEERKKTFFAELGCIGGMFIGEGWMKKNLDRKVLSKIAKLPIDKKWMPVVKGALFVAGSITASTIGEKLTKKIYEFDEKRIAKKQAQAVEQHKAQEYTNKVQNQAYTPMNLKA